MCNSSEDSMRWEQAINLKQFEFQRLTGISFDLFDKLTTAVRQARNGRGRPPKLSIEDQVLMTLFYWKAYPPLWRLGLEFGISEATASRTVVSVEDDIMKSGAFRMQGKKLEWMDPSGHKQLLSMQPSSKLKDQRKGSVHIIVESIRITE